MIILQEVTLCYRQEAKTWRATWLTELLRCLDRSEAKRDRIRISNNQMHHDLKPSS